MAQTAMVDSLYNAMNNTSAEDSLRCNALTLYATNLTYNHPDSMEQLVLEGLDNYRNKGLYTCECSLYNNLGLIEHNRGDGPKARSYFEKAFELTKKHGLRKERYTYYNNIGILDLNDLDYETAIKNFRTALKIASQFEEIKTHNTLHNIALCYNRIDNPEKALEYYKLSLDERKQLKDTLSMLYSYINIGVLYMNQEVSDSAVMYFKLSKNTAKDINDLRVLGFAEINLSNIYHGEEMYDEGIEAAKAAQEAFRLSNNSNMEQMGYLAESRLHIAKEDYAQGLKLARMFKDTSLVPDNIHYLGRYYDRMYDAHKGLNNYDSALVYLELMHEHEASTNKAGAAQELENFEAEKRALQDSLAAVNERKALEEAHQLTVNKKNKQRNILILAGILVFGLSVYLFRRWKTTSKEKEASDELLDNILPSEISAQIKAKGTADSRHIESASILFTDFKGFTSLSESIDPETLIDDLNTCFSEFDRIIEKHGLEKIKTIGDAYMAAGGINSDADDHPERMVMAALEIRDFIEEGKNKKLAEGLPYFEIRLGIHTGGVVAGIVGIKKLQYDLWGDTVNTASRMESSSEVGKVNISQACFEKVKDNPLFTFEHRGKLEAKGKGQMDMYFVEKSV